MRKVLVCVMVILAIIFCESFAHDLALSKTEETQIKKAAMKNISATFAKPKILHVIGGYATVLIVPLKKGGGG